MSYSFILVFSHYQLFRVIVQVRKTLLFKVKLREIIILATITCIIYITICVFFLFFFLNIFWCDVFLNQKWFLMPTINIQYNSEDCMYVDLQMSFRYICHCVPVSFACIQVSTSMLSNILYYWKQFIIEILNTSLFF